MDTKTAQIEVGQQLVLANHGSSGWHKTRYMVCDVTRKSPTGIVTATHGKDTVTMQPSGHIAVKSESGFVDKRWCLSNMEALGRARAEQVLDIRKGKVKQQLEDLRTKVQYMPEDKIAQIEAILTSLEQPVAV